MSGATQAPVRWWWIRHAATDARGLIGWTDAPADLSDLDALARRRKGLPKTARLLTSDLRRSRDTAAALYCEGWSATQPIKALREMNMGAWEGLTHDAVPEKEAQAFWRAPADVAPPNGESFSTVCHRVTEVIRAENAAAEGAKVKDIVAVAHAGVVRAALGLALNLDPERALCFEVAPLSLTRIDWHGAKGGWGIGGVNQP